MKNFFEHIEINDIDGCGGVNFKFNFFFANY